MQELAGRRVLVIGLGLSGQSAADYCVRHGALVTAADDRPESALGELSLPGDVTLCAGGPLPDPRDFDLVVPSPGVPPERYRARAKQVWGDVELAARALAIPLVAVTGTNGKSTTVSLIETMLRGAGFRARAAGNLGTPALDLVGAPLDVAILEVSSFQLETIDRFAPKVAVLLNLTPDHLDRHGSLAAYAAAKARIFENQGVDDVAVVRGNDPQVQALARGARGRVLEFGARGPFAAGAWLDAGTAVLRPEPGAELVRLSLEGLPLVGPHNRENLLAALCAAVAVGAEGAKALAGALHFEGLPHRCERVARIAGVDYVDDSKATNPSAAIRSLESFAAPVVWIAGGRAKGLDLTALAEAARGVRQALLLGEAADAMAAALGDDVAFEHCPDIDAAVARAHAIARSGDVVLLAPGCSSLDQFRNFEERGRRFQEAVHALASRGDSA